MQGQLAEKSYFQRLDLAAREHYINKLKVIISGREFMVKDPYENGDFVDNVSLWPPVDYGCIYTYLINTKGVYTQETLKAYKSLQAYLYYESGYVQTVFYDSVDKECPTCILKAKVCPSQRCTERPHEAWIMVEKKSGLIQCAHCTCLAGLGEVCSHVAAVLFKVEAAHRLELGKLSCTDVACTWNQAFCKKVTPAPAHKIQFSSKRSWHTPNEAGEKIYAKENLLTLKKACPDAACLTCFSSEGSSTDTASEAEDILRELPVSAGQTQQNTKSAECKNQASSFCLKYTKENFKCDTVEELLSDLRNITKDDIAEICSITQDGAQCTLWFDYRYGRITGSVLHEVLQSMKPNSRACKDRLVKQILQKTHLTNVPYQVRWGREHEKVALEDYAIHLVAVGHINVQLQKTGLHISENYPFIAATPDAIVKCDCCGSRVVEVKCPCNKWDVHLHDITDPNVAKRVLYLKYIDGQITLRKTHKYFAQVQCQMGCSELKKCDFVVWTTKSLWFETIEFNEKYWLESATVCKKFFCDLVYSKLIN